MLNLLRCSLQQDLHGGAGGPVLRVGGPAPGGHAALLLLPHLQLVTRHRDSGQHMNSLSALQIILFSR